MSSNKPKQKGSKIDRIVAAVIGLIVLAAFYNLFT
jgi:hypothetical protein